MWFTWSSGARRSSRFVLLSPRLLPFAVGALSRRDMVRAMSSSGKFRLRGEDPVDVAAPWPFTAAL
jgi:hypothetical protein